MELPILKARELLGAWVTSWLRMRRPRSATWWSGRTPLTQRPLMKWSRSAVLVIAAFMMGWRRVVDSVGHRKEVCTLYALHLLRVRKGMRWVVFSALLLVARVVFYFVAFDVIVIGLIIGSRAPIVLHTATETHERALVHTCCLILLQRVFFAR